MFSLHINMRTQICAHLRMWLKTHDKTSRCNLPDVYARQCLCRSKARGTCPDGSSSETSTSCTVKLILQEIVGPKSVVEKPEK
jgi:hypothetical protein